LPLSRLEIWALGAEAVTAACEGNEKQIATAEEEYSVDNGGAYVVLTSLTTPYLSTNISDPVKKGNAYTVVIPGSGSNGSYEIDDAGGHDSTTTTRLTLTSGGTACATCTSIIYAQSSGIHGK
jgi:hypothetical protein